MDLRIGLRIADRADIASQLLLSLPKRIHILRKATNLARNNLYSIR